MGGDTYRKIELVSLPVDLIEHKHDGGHAEGQQAQRGWVGDSGGSAIRAQQGLEGSSLGDKAPKVKVEVM